MLAPHPTRLRSHSSPVLPRGSSTHPEVAPNLGQGFLIEPVEEASEPQENWRSQHSSPRAVTHSRKVFRLKRPSSSSAAMDPSYTSDLRAGGGASSSQPISMARRANSPPAARPSSSAGLPERTRLRSASSVSESLRDSSFFRGFGPIMGAGTDFVLQRKKSRSSKPCKPPARIPNVPEDFAGELQFSTPDRAILEELKKKMQAREDQFKIKNGKRHHPFPPDVVPYPRSYEKHVIDNDIWEYMWAKSLCGRLTWYIPSVPPARVLDLGCGSGAWTLDCAMQWQDTYFVGLDIVPLHPDLQQIGLAQLASRITWIQANFLEGLPFQNGEFDFVQAKRIARGVPEDKWDKLIEEIHRVLKPGGAFQLLEEDMTFPGKLLGAKSTEAIDLTASTAPSLSRISLSVDTHGSTASASSSTATLPLNKRSFESTTPLLARPSITPPFTGSAGSLGVASPASTLPTTPERPRSPEQSPPNPEPTEQELLDGIVYGKTKPKPLFDPRDHSLLEYIYNEMHAQRFINLEPLALLKNNLSLIFDEVCTHPPLVFTFPPRPAGYDTLRSKRQSRSLDLRTTLHSDLNLLPMSLEEVSRGMSPYLCFDYTRMGSTPRPRRPSHVNGGRSSGRNSRNHSADGPRTATADFLGVEELPSHDLVALADMHFDPRSLNMHLALRVQEVLACAEEMWRFVVGYQEKYLSAYDELGEGTWRGLTRARQAFHEDLIGLHRKDFDDMLTRFRLDMEDNMLLPMAVRDRLGWPPVRSPVPPERLEFEELCEKWERHQLHGEASEPASLRTSRASSRASNGFSNSAELSRRLGALEGVPLPEHGSPVSMHAPTERCSRTVRSFVAWKAGPTSSFL